MRRVDALALKFDQMLEDRQKIAKVTAIDGTKVWVSLENGSLKLSRNAAYTPTVGDVVVVNALTPGSWFVLCKIA